MSGHPAERGQRFVFGQWFKRLTHPSGEASGFTFGRWRGKKKGLWPPQAVPFLWVVILQANQQRAFRKQVGNDEAKRDCHGCNIGHQEDKG